MIKSLIAGNDAQEFTIHEETSAVPQGLSISPTNSSRSRLFDKFKIGSTNLNNIWNETSSLAPTIQESINCD